MLAGISILNVCCLTACVVLTTCAICAGRAQAFGADVDRCCPQEGLVFINLLDSTAKCQAAQACVLETVFLPAAKLLLLLLSALLGVAAYLGVLFKSDWPL